MEPSEGHPGTTLLRHLLYDEVVQSSPAYEKIVSVLRETLQIREGTPDEVELWFLMALRHQAIRSALPAEKRDAAGTVGPGGDWGGSRSACRRIGPLREKARRGARR